MLFPITSINAIWSQSKFDHYATCCENVFMTDTLLTNHININVGSKDRAKATLLHKCLRFIGFEVCRCPYLIGWIKDSCYSASTCFDMPSVYWKCYCQRSNITQSIKSIVQLWIQSTRYRISHCKCSKKRHSWFNDRNQFIYYVY